MFDNVGSPGFIPATVERNSALKRSSKRRPVGGTKKGASLPPQQRDVLRARLAEKRCEQLLKKIEDQRKSGDKVDAFKVCDDLRGICESAQLKAETERKLIRRIRPVILTLVAPSPALSELLGGEEEESAAVSFDPNQLNDLLTRIQNTAMTSSTPDDVLESLGVEKIESHANDKTASLKNKQPIDRINKDDLKTQTIAEVDEDGLSPIIHKKPSEESMTLFYEVDGRFSERSSVPNRDSVDNRDSTTLKRDSDKSDEVEREDYKLEARHSISSEGSSNIPDNFDDSDDESSSDDDIDPVELFGSGRRIIQTFDDDDDDDDNSSFGGSSTSSRGGISGFSGLGVGGNNRFGNRNNNSNTSITSYPDWMQRAAFNLGINMRDCEFRMNNAVNGVNTQGGSSGSNFGPFSPPGRTRQSPAAGMGSSFPFTGMFKRNSENSSTIVSTSNYSNISSQPNSNTTSPKRTPDGAAITENLGIAAGLKENYLVQVEDDDDDDDNVSVASSLSRTRSERGDSFDSKEDSDKSPIKLSPPAKSELTSSPIQIQDGYLPEDNIESSNNATKKVLFGGSEVSEFEKISNSTRSPKNANSEECDSDATSTTASTKPVSSPSANIESEKDEKTDSETALNLQTNDIGVSSRKNSEDGDESPTLSLLRSKLNASEDIVKSSSSSSSEKIDENPNSNSGSASARTSERSDISTSSVPKKKGVLPWGMKRLSQNSSGSTSRKSSDDLNDKTSTLNNLVLKPSAASKAAGFVSQYH